MTKFSTIDETIVSDNLEKNLDGNNEVDFFWNQCLEIIKDNVSTQVYNTWFEPLKPIEMNNNQLVIQVPSQFFCEWIDEHYYPLLSKSIDEVIGNSTELKYHVVIDEHGDSLEKRTIKLPPSKVSHSTSQQSLPFSNTPAFFQEYPTFLNPRYTIDNFISGDSNHLAYSAAKAICENPGGSKYKLLFIYGKTGLGKTHLVQAVGNYLVNKYRRIKVAYTTGDRFYLDYLNALQNNKINEFTNYYRSADILIVDDIHFFSGKEKTQDHFFHTFNHLHQNGKQIILTSDRHQKDIKDVDDRLISRFQWGLTADIQSPDFEMRVALLRKKSADEGLELSQEIIEYIARNVTKHVRELEGVLISLFARVTMDRKPLTLQLVKQLIEGARSLEPRIITIEAIKQEVSSYYNISLDLMESSLRKHEVALARQMSMYLAKHLTQLSLKSIGASFGNRDHSTVLHSCQAIENYFITDKNVKNAYEHILRRIKREI